MTRQKIPTLRPISISELTIESKPAVKYLSLMLDSKMSFFEQIKATVDRAAAGVAALNVEGPISTRRRLLKGATQLVLLFIKKSIISALLKCRDGVLCSPVSKPAVMVIVGMISVALLAEERKAIYRRKGENLR